MKILHMLITDAFSGSESVAAHIIKNLPPEYKGIYTSPAGEAHKVCSSMGVDTLVCNTSDTGEIKRAFIESSADIVHAHDPHMSFNCARAGVPFISHLHCNCDWLKRICPNSLALAYTVKKAKRVLCVSSSIAEEYVFKSFMRDKQLCLPNCVDSREVIAKSTAAILPENWDMAFIGRMSAPKQPVEFVRLVSLVKSKLPNVTAVMVGDGELREAVEQAIEKYALSNSVTLVGYKENPYTYMRNSRVGVLTSAQEGFGLAAVEMMSLGKPFFAYPNGGLKDIVSDSCGGLYSSAETMADAVVETLCDGSVYSAKSLGAYEASRRFTDMTAYIAKLCAVYDSAVS